VEKMLDSREAARRLGVKPATLYAYVSRGLLTSHPSPDGRHSLFELADVERLAKRARGGREVETRLATITTSITQLTDDGPIYRGTPASALATTATFEEVAALLWQVAPGPWEPLKLAAPKKLRGRDALRWADVMAGAADTARGDLRPEAVDRAARRLVASMVAALPAGAGAGDGDRDTDRPGALRLDRRAPIAGSMAARLAARMAEKPPSAALIRAVNAALVLLADHELATSALAARLAASTRADVYDVVLAGLGAVGGPLHGSASPLAFQLFATAEREGPDRAVADALRWRGAIAGFGHSVYTVADPRAPVLFDLVEDLAGERRWRTVRALLDAAAEAGQPAPTIDAALGALGYVAGLPPDGLEVVFSVARTAGWVAHALEEYGERGLRFRARAVYVSS
jgi:citrate synthase